LDEQQAKVKVLERIEDAKNRKRELANQLDALQFKLQQKQKLKESLAN
jgi:hypothetical protein